MLRQQFTPNGGRSPEGSHMSLYVNIEGTLYITDVGFGDLPTSIIEIGSKHNSFQHMIKWSLLCCLD